MTRSAVRRRLVVMSTKVARVRASEEVVGGIAAGGR
ncbi:hypothetical protein QE381_002701 [Microbacterium sp. SORGH_AS 888]|nr:hypothetical protein [Microbacterium sp. SORGH_AS_0888]